MMHFNVINKCTSTLNSAHWMTRRLLDRCYITTMNYYNKLQWSTELLVFAGISLTFLFNFSCKTHFTKNVSNLLCSLSTVRIQCIYLGSRHEIKLRSIWLIINYWSCNEYDFNVPSPDSTTAFPSISEGGETSFSLFSTRRRSPLDTRSWRRPAAPSRPATAL